MDLGEQLQTYEQLTRNEQVSGSSPTFSGAERYRFTGKGRTTSPSFRLSITLIARRRHRLVRLGRLGWSVLYF